jgi:tRNA threonylcarbamoyladenosine biosynthesis protein TsaE
MTIFSASPEETIAAGERIAKLLLSGFPCEYHPPGFSNEAVKFQGHVVALRGTLGAGKTCLTKGIARFFGVKEEVTSPTYTIISEYEGALPFYHIDAYRLQGDEDFDVLGGEDILYAGGVSVIEWSERIPHSIPPDALIVELEILNEGGRRIQVHSNSGGA